MNTWSAVRRANPADAQGILELRDGLEQWLVDKGIRQWDPGEVTQADIYRQIAVGHWYVLRRHDAVVGALRLLWSDGAVWPPDNTSAAYVHGLMVRRDIAGQGIGARLLQWAADQARRAGADELRLDCVESNQELRAYYAQLGFAEVGRRDFDGPWYSAVLLSQHLPPEVGASPRQ